MSGYQDRFRIPQQHEKSQGGPSELLCLHAAVARSVPAIARPRRIS